MERYVKRTILFLFTIVFAGFFSFSLLSVSSSFAFEDNVVLHGKPFTNPFEGAMMDEMWLSKKITYESWAENAALAVTLDQHLYPVLLPLIKTFAQKKNMDIAVREGTCGISAGMISRKSVDIAGFCCPPGKEDRFPGVKFHTIGIASLGILVNAKNPVDNLSIDEARSIFQGKIYTWSELKTPAGEKGPDRIIRTIGRLHCKARPGHWRLILDNSTLYSSRMLEVGTIPDMLSKVSSIKDSIGFEVLWNIERYQKTDSVKFLKINGFSPDNPEHLISGQYPFYRVYNLTTWERKELQNQTAQTLVDNLMDAVQDIDYKHGIIPASHIRNAGWKFKKNELIGAPE